MHILIGLAALFGGIGIWIMRARNAANAANDLADMAGDVLAAARRFGFRRRYNQHPVEAIEDQALAEGALTVAFLDLGAAATTEQRARHMQALQNHLGVNRTEAEELLVMGHWLVNECNGPAPAVARIGKRVMKLGGAGALDAPLQVIDEVAGATGGLNDSQRDALHDLRNIFRR